MLYEVITVWHACHLRGEPLIVVPRVVQPRIAERDRFRSENLGMRRGREVDGVRRHVRGEEDRLVA